jgi:hypothetical protein
MHMNTAQQLPDPSDLSLDDLRLLRQQMQLEDDAVSYARRVAQARLDIVKAEAERRLADGEVEVAGELRTVLSQHLTGGPARPPRPERQPERGPMSSTRRPWLTY